MPSCQMCFSRSANLVAFAHTWLMPVILVNLQAAWPTDACGIRCILNIIAFRCLCIWIFIYVTSIIYQLQVEVGSSSAMEGFYV